MKISGSILTINNNKEKINEMINSGIDYLHLDVMDGIFVQNKSLLYDKCKEISDLFKIPLDVHLMVDDPYKHILDFINLKPKYITFHCETNNIEKNIDILKNNNILVGLAINPETDISKIIPYLDRIDLVLILSVNPGYGGQKFIDDSLNKVKLLKEYKIKNNLNYEIEVDGGINTNNIKKIESDIIVIGSGITNSNNYKDQVLKIKELL